jgi:hypothetical protein
VTDAFDRPAAAELVEAVRQFLEDEVLDALDGRLRYLTRVAVNSLGMVERELGDGGRAAAARDQLLTTLGMPDEAALGAAIRRGDLDDRLDEVAAVLRPHVAAKVDVAHPGYRDGD